MSRAKIWTQDLWIWIQPLYHWANWLLAMLPNVKFKIHFYILRKRATYWENVKFYNHRSEGGESILKNEVVLTTGPFDDPTHWKQTILVLPKRESQGQNGKTKIRQHISSLIFLITVKL